MKVKVNTPEWQISERQNLGKQVKLYSDLFQDLKRERGREGARGRVGKGERGEGGVAAGILELA